MNSKVFRLVTMLAILQLGVAAQAQYEKGSGLLSKTMLLNAGYHFTYLSNSFYRDGLVHLVQLGIGFQFE